MKKYNFRNSLFWFLRAAFVTAILFRLVRHHWPSWDLVLYSILIYCFWEVWDFRNFQAFERKRLARKERLNQLGIGDKNNYV